MTDRETTETTETTYTETTDYSFLWRDEVTEAEFIAGYQALIDNGMAWRLEGHVGRTAMALIESGACILGPVGHYDAYGGYVPGRDEVEPGTKGSPEYRKEG